jgi:hypothetical protein
MLARTGRGDHKWDQERQQDEGREQIARTRHRRNRRDQRPGGRQADVGEQQDKRERDQPGGRVEEEEREDRHRDQFEGDEVDHQGARLRGEKDRAVDGGQSDEVEAALLALGDEQAVDRE